MLKKPYIQVCAPGEEVHPGRKKKSAGKEPGGGAWGSEAQDLLSLGSGLRAMIASVGLTLRVKKKPNNSVDRYHSCSTTNTKQHCGKQCSQKHVSSPLAFAQACQTTYSEMPCAYYN